MILNSKGKLFGKISIVDILVIILVLAAAVGIVFRVYISKSSDFQAYDEIGYRVVDFNYTINVNGIRESNMEHLIKSKNQEFCLNGDTEFTMGILKDIEVTEAKTIITKQDGTIVSAIIPERYDVKLTFQISGHEKTDGYYTPQLYELAVGKSYSISSLYSSVYGTIEKIWK